MMRLETGVVMGLPLRETRIGALSSACGRRARFANAQALFAISDFRHAESRTAGAWLQSSNPTKNLGFLDFPFRFAVHREAVRRKVQGTQFPAGGLRAAPLKYPEGSMT